MRDPTAFAIKRAFSLEFLERGHYTPASLTPLCEFVVRHDYVTNRRLFAAARQRASRPSRTVGRAGALDVDVWLE